MNRILQPQGWARPRGYSNGVAARGTYVAIAGQVGSNAQGKIETDDFAEQARLALANVLAVLREAGGGPQNIVQMNWYVTSRDEYLAAGARIGPIWKDLMTGPGGAVAFPAMTLLVVSGLLDPAAKLEIDASAIIHD